MRQFLAALLALAACLVLPLALVAAWLGTVVDDTDRYVETVGPLATDAQVVDAVTDTVALRTLQTIDEQVSVGTGVPAELESVVEGGVRTVVTSPQFPPAWEAANTEAHEQLIAQLRSTSTGDSDVSLDLGPVLDRVVQQVGDELPFPVTAPDVSLPVTVLQGEQVQQARAAYDVLTAARVLGPAAWLALVVLALLLSPRRPGTLALIGVVSAVTLGLLLLVLRFVRDQVVDAAAPPDRILTGAVWDGVTSSLDLLVLVSLGLAALLVVLGGALGIATRPRA